MYYIHNKIVMKIEMLWLKISNILLLYLMNPLPLLLFLFCFLLRCPPYLSLLLLIWLKNNFLFLFYLLLPLIDLVFLFTLSLFVHVCPGLNFLLSFMRSIILLLLLLGAAGCCCCCCCFFDLWLTFGFYYCCCWNWLSEIGSRWV